MSKYFAPTAQGSIFNPNDYIKTTSESLVDNDTTDVLQSNLITSINTNINSLINKNTDTDTSLNAIKSQSDTTDTNLLAVQDKTTNISQIAGVTTISGILDTLGAEIGSTSNSLLGKNCGSVVTGTNNCVIGYESGKFITTGSKNTILGTWATNSTSHTPASFYTTSVGYGTNALKSNSTAIGSQSHAGPNCTSIGKDAGTGVWSTATNNLCLGYEAGSGYLTSQSNKIWLGNSSIDALYCNVQSISALSDERDKLNIGPLEDSLDCTAYIGALNPKTYRMNPRMRYRRQFEDASNNTIVEFDTNDESKADTDYSVGLIAQEVKEYEDSLGLTNPILVKEMNSDTYALSYSNLIPILVKALNESNERIAVLEELLL